jgi:superfamily I DNA/RNA helicase
LPEHSRHERHERLHGSPPIVSSSVALASAYQFSHMILTGVEAGVIPQPDTSGLPDAEAEARERSLVYVAATRTRAGLTVTGTGALSRLL